MHMNQCHMHINTIVNESCKDYMSEGQYYTTELHEREDIS